MRTKWDNARHTIEYVSFLVFPDIAILVFQRLTSLDFKVQLLAGEVVEVHRFLVLAVVGFLRPSITSPFIPPSSIEAGGSIYLWSLICWHSYENVIVL